MPIKDKPSAGGSAKQQLIPVGKRDVLAKSQPKDGKQEKGPKPTTEKALILRNGKYGARGTGELMLMGRMTGREKMDLLAGKQGSLMHTSVTLTDGAYPRMQKISLRNPRRLY